jgi:hypothetical protein
VLAPVHVAQFAPHAAHTPPAVDVAVEKVAEGQDETQVVPDKAKLAAQAVQVVDVHDAQLAEQAVQIPLEAA